MTADAWSRKTASSFLFRLWWFWISFVLASCFFSLFASLFNSRLDSSSAGEEEKKKLNLVALKESPVAPVKDAIGKGSKLIIKMDFPSSRRVYAYWLCSAHWFRLAEMRRPKELSDMRPHTPWHWLRSEELVCALVLSLWCSFGLLTECCWCHHWVWTQTCLHEPCTQIHKRSCVCWICGLHSKWRQLDDLSFSAQFSYIMSCQSESSLCLFCCFHSMSWWKTVEKNQDRL